MRIGFIGAGAIGQAIAFAALRGGHEVVLSNSRGPESLAGVVQRLGTGASAGTRLEAADNTVVVLSVPWRSVESAVSGLSWEGQVVLDTNNPIQAPDFVPAELHGRTSSEIVAGLVPGARLVKTLNIWPPELIVSEPLQAGGRRVQFVSGDDLEAKVVASRLLQSFGFAVIDLGGLATGGALQQFPGGVLPTLNLVKLG